MQQVLHKCVLRMNHQSALGTAWTQEIYGMAVLTVTILVWQTPKASLV